MQLCNDTITLYNRRFDPDEDCDVYERTVIRGVHWFNSEATTVDSTGLKAANKVTIRIPVDADFGGKAYLPPKQYAAADDPAPDHHHVASGRRGPRKADRSRLGNRKGHHWASSSTRACMKRQPASNWSSASHSSG